MIHQEHEASIVKAVEAIGKHEAMPMISKQYSTSAGTQRRLEMFLVCFEELQREGVG